MKCENQLCIYQDNNNCTNKNEFEIDWHGLCKNMVPVRFSKRILNSSKLVTQLELKDGNHLYDKETGRIVLTGDAFEFYNNDFDK